MIVINTTFILDDSIKQEAIKWIIDSYAASAIKAGAIPQETMLAKVMGHDDDGAQSFALHLAFSDYAIGAKWEQGVGTKLKAKLTERWGEKALAFSTYLEPIDIASCPK